MRSSGSLKSQDVEKKISFSFYRKKRPLMGKLSKFCSERIHRHTDVMCSNFLEIWRLAVGKSVKSCVIYLTKNSTGSPVLATARIAPKICQGQPPHNVLRVFHISSKSVHFRWSYIQTREHRHSALESESNIRLRPSFEPNKYNAPDPETVKRNVVATKCLCI